MGEIYSVSVDKVNKGQVRLCIEPPPPRDVLEMICQAAPEGSTPCVEEKEDFALGTVPHFEENPPSELNPLAKEGCVDFDLRASNKNLKRIGEIVTAKLLKLQPAWEVTLKIDGEDAPLSDTPPQTPA